MKKTWTIIGIVLAVPLIGIGGAFLYLKSRPQSSSISPTSTGELSESEKALYAALDDEYKALSTCQKVMEIFGEVRPFVNIAKAEEEHIAALSAL